MRAFPTSSGRGNARRAALALLSSAAWLSASAPPAGSDGAIAMAEDSARTLSPADFGFTDAGDDPANIFKGLRVASLPTQGILAIDGVAARAGDFVSLFPEPGKVWTDRVRPHFWQALASSADGSKLLAAPTGSDNGARLYVSADSGASWTARESSRNWGAVAASADGTRMAATAMQGMIYVSGDSGATWVARGTAQFWVSIASSADGARLAAATGGGPIYTSIDYGATWTPRGVSRNWASVASSADGTRLVAAVRDGGAIFTSVDAGATWVERPTGGSWQAVASSADGLRLVALDQRAADGKGVWTSGDGGVTWQPHALVGYWSAVACSADGSHLAALADQIYLSQDFGETWSARGLGNSWSAVASSADGNKLVAAAQFGSIYTSEATTPILTFTPTPDAFGAPYADFTFQVADNGAAGADLDPTPNRLTFSVAAQDDAPRLAAALPDQAAPTGLPFEYRLAEGSFVDPDPGSVLTYAATRADGSALPGWLSFEAGTATFRGMPTAAETWEIKVTATDGSAAALAGSGSFRLQVSGLPVGTDGAVALLEEGNYTFKAADFGFSDPLESVAQRFTGIRITTMPDLGTLTLDGNAVAAGDSVSMIPIPGVAWTAQTSLQGAWALANSADGVNLVAVNASGQLAVSSNSGVSWTTRGAARQYSAVASSSGGSRLVAVVENGQIYTSQDSGFTWVAREQVRQWYGVASSADGSKLVACDRGAAGGRLYTSLDYGVTWTPRETFRYWSAVASSADGTRLAAVTNHPNFVDYVYISTDSGVTWTPRGTTGSRRAIASSADGARLVTVENGRMSLSADGGATWRHRDGTYYWKAVASSADGLRLVAAEHSGGRIYVSADGGATWIPRETGRNWLAVASSADGQKLWAGAENSPVYASVPSAPRLVYTPPPDGVGAPFSTFRFQVEDSGPAGANRDPAPKVLALNVANLNDAPTAGPPLDPQTALKGLPFAWVLPAESFADVDAGNVFSFVVRQADGRALPNWLAFDPATRRFSGQPGPADIGVMELLVTATDNGQPPASAPNGFRLTVPSDAPVGTDGQATLDEDGSYAFSAADFGFRDLGDSPANRFSQLKLLSTPAAGSLKVDGIALGAGEWVRMVPDARMVWTPRDSARPWSSLASSADGVKLAAVATQTFSGGPGQIYTSADSGETWTARGTARNWYQIASSADGSKLVASVLEGLLYTSVDSGATWVARSSGSRDWIGLASSADGTRLAGVAYSSLPSNIYLSVNGGATWASKGPERYWQAVTCSADGTRLLACTYEGPLYTSSDSGATWTPRETNRRWRSVASSADGWKLVAAVSGGQIYTSSDGGANWVARDSPRSWSAVVSSADGLRLAATVSGGRLYTSIDAGVSWTPCESARNWSDLATSDDGLKLVAAVDNSKLYTSTAALPQLVFQPAAQGFGQPYASFGFQVGDDGVEGSTAAVAPNTFSLFVNAVNDAPTAAAVLPDRYATERSAFSATLAANSFVDPDNDTVLTYSASMGDGSPLPAWLTFAPAARTLSGTPGIRDTGAFAIKVTAHDQGQPPLSASSTFLLMVANVDGPPVGAGGSATLAPDSSYEFQAADFGFSDPTDFPPNAFTRVKLSTLPVAGSLRIDGAPAAVGAFASLVPSPAGSTWIPRATVQNWLAIASSADGMSLGAVVNGGKIYTSADAGLTWTARDGNRAWYSITSSADGLRLAAVVQNGQLYTSSDAGATWTAREVNRNWRTITSSADGLRLVAIVNNGQIYTSADAGATWTARETVRAWYSIASSADGLKLLAAVQNGPLYTSLDAGATWTPRDSFRNWRTVASSADGAKLAASVNGGQIYLSNDSGLTWTAREASRNWYSISTSADGSRLAAVVSSGQIYTSSDSGATWRPRDSARNWRAIASSADGNRLTAVVIGDRPYTSGPTPAQALTYTPAEGGLGAPYASFTYQVEDDGGPTANLDLTPRTFTLNVAALSPFAQWAAQHALPADPAAANGAHLLDFAFGLDPAGTGRNEIVVGPGGISQRGRPALRAPNSPADSVFHARFGRLKGSGLIYSVEFSADLALWQAGRAAPAVLADDGLLEACEVPFPAQLDGGQPPQFFRVVVRMP
jgi:hypothetical protein